MAEENISLQSMALQKRSSQTALMPPPPPPKRLKRPPKTLTEEDYTSAISTIIERDFYPNLSEIRLQSKYLDAVEEGNPIRIATAARKLTNQIGGRADNGAAGEEGETEEERRERILKEDVKGMRLDMFQAKYTSEDNESFNALLDEQNEKNREKYAWKYNGNKMLSKQEFLIEQKRVLLLEDGTEQVVVTGERDPSKEIGDTWSKEIQTWKWTPQNVLMNPHPGIENQVDPSQGLKLIHHKNTAIPSSSSSTHTGRTPAPSPSLSTVQDAIEGKIRANTPKVNGYNFVSTPTPSELGAPKMTWGELSATPVRLSTAEEAETPNPFRLAEPTERDKLARKLAEKAQKDITARQRAYTPRLRTTNASLGTPRTAHGTGTTPRVGKTPLQGDIVPKFGSSPDIRKQMLTPAAQRLWASTAQGKRSSSRLAEKGQRERESAAQVSANVVGRTPLMRTPMLKDASTPRHHK